MSRFTLSITAQDADIDELGHVNNAVWVQWIQAIATAHWEAVAPAEHKLAYVWVVTRHEIDYRGSVVAGETVVGETWVEGAPKGARFDRHVRFLGDDGRVKLEAVTTWALLDRATGRLMRVREDVAAPFYPPRNGEGDRDAQRRGGGGAPQALRLCRSEDRRCA